MSKRFMDPKAKILVAINFDEQASQLIHLAQAIHARTGLTIRLVHVVEPTLREVYPGTLDITGAIRDAADEIDESNTREARERLYALEANFFGGQDTTSISQKPSPEGAPSVERVVLLGQPAEALIAEATLSGAALILCGAGSKHDHYVPTGFSTALSLMTSAPCPVLIQSVRCTQDLSRGATKLLIADDLGATGYEAMITGLDLARALGNTEVLHTTVAPTSQPWFLALKNKLTAATTAKVPVSAATQQFFEGVTKDIEAKLQRRAPEHVALLAARGSRYATKVLHGTDIPEEVHQASKDFGADIVVYGRHRAFHREPWALGKIAWHNMLAGHRLVVIAPPA